MKSFVLLLIVGLSSAPAWSSDPVTFQTDSVPQILEDMDKATMKQWDKLTHWQNNGDWVNRQVEAQVVGSIYGYAWAGPNVKRSIYPGDAGDWLVIDEVSLSMGLGFRLASTVANLFLMEAFPYLQIGPIKEKTYVSVRHRTTYKEALLAKPFLPGRLPVNADALEKLELGELVGTVNKNGFLASAGLDGLAMLGVKSPVSVGGFAKVLIAHQFNVNVWRSRENQVHVLLQDVGAKTLGFGTGLGLTSHVLPGPVQLGVESKNGFFPIVLNRKDEWSEGSSQVFTFALDRPSGREAYSTMMGRDLTKVQEELKGTENPGVTRDLVKNGRTHEVEKNYGVNLVLYKRGVRKVQKHSEYDSTLSDGRVFHYDERELRDVRQKQVAWGDKRLISRRFSTLSPIAVADQEQPLDSDNSFVFDVEFKVASQKLKGKTLSEQLLNPVEELLESPNFFPAVADQEEFRELRGEVRIRFGLMAMKLFLEVDEPRLWMSLAQTLGISDPTLWATPKGRLDWSTRPAPSTLELNLKEKKEVLEKATKIMLALTKVRKEKAGSARAEAFLGLMKDKNLRAPTLRLASRVVGRQALVVTGQIQSGK